MEDTDANEADSMSRTRQLLPYPTTAGVQETLVNLSLLLDFGKRRSRTASPPDMAGKAFSTLWAVGDVGDLDYSPLDELSNFYAVTAVCAVGHDDIRSSYSEAGANLWVCGPSNSGRDGQPGIATTENGNRYRGSFGSTSAAAPIVSAWQR